MRAQNDSLVLVGLTLEWDLLTVVVDLLARVGNQLAG